MVALLQTWPPRAHLTAAAVLEAIDQRDKTRRRELRAYQIRVVITQLPLDGRDAPLVRGARAVHCRPQLGTRIDACELREGIVEAPAIY